MFPNFGQTHAMISIEELPAHLSLVPKAEWSALFAFLPELKKPKVKDKVVNNLVDHAYYMQLIVAFDWMNWKEGAELLKSASKDYSSLDGVTLCKLLAMVVRSEKFNEGSLATYVNDGTLVGILEGLRRVFPS
jgi:hypothetical protein